MPHAEALQRVFNVQVVLQNVVRLHADALRFEVLVEMDVHERVERALVPGGIDREAEEPVVPQLFDSQQQPRPAERQEVSIDALEQDVDVREPQAEADGLAFVFHDPHRVRVDDELELFEHVLHHGQFQRDVAPVAGERRVGDFPYGARVARQIFHVERSDRYIRKARQKSLGELLVALRERVAAADVCLVNQQILDLFVPRAGEERVVVFRVPGRHIDGRRVVTRLHEPPIFRGGVNRPADGVHAARAEPGFRRVHKEFGG